jgi:hypothetical protein
MNNLPGDGGSTHLCNVGQLQRDYTALHPEDSKLMLIYWTQTNIVEKNTEALFDISKEVGLDVNVEKTGHMFMSRHQTN